ncbi:MAG: aspartyl protease family protein [Paraglaciecola sp.]|jgi:aspartyl protease family protein
MLKNMPGKDKSEHSQGNIGKGMFFLAWAAGLGLLTLLFDDQLARQFNPNPQPLSRQAQGITEVKLQQNRSGHYVASGLINSQPVVFLLDTGATEVSVPFALAGELNLLPGRTAWVQTANGRVQVAQTTIEHLQIGGIALHNVRAHLNYATGSSEILLGMSALKQLEFTQQKDILILRSL